MAIWFLLQETVVLIFFCGISYCEKDLLEILKFKLDDPPELIDFIQSVLKQKDEFRRIREGAKRIQQAKQGHQQAMSELNHNPSNYLPEISDNSIMKRSQFDVHSKEDYFNGYPPVNNIYPYVRNNNEQDDDSEPNLTSLYEIVDKNVRKKQIRHRKIKRSSKARHRRGLDLNDYNSGNDFGSSNIKVVPRSESGVQKVPGKKFSWLRAQRFEKTGNKLRKNYFNSNEYNGFSEDAKRDNQAKSGEKLNEILRNRNVQQNEVLAKEVRKRRLANMNLFHKNNRKRRVANIRMVNYRNSDRNLKTDRQFASPRYLTIKNRNIRKSRKKTGSHPYTTSNEKPYRAQAENLYRTKDENFYNAKEGNNINELSFQSLRDFNFPQLDNQVSDSAFTMNKNPFPKRPTNTINSMNWNDKLKMINSKRQPEMGFQKEQIDGNENANVPVPNSLDQIPEKVNSLQDVDEPTSAIEQYKLSTKPFYVTLPEKMDNLLSSQVDLQSPIATILFSTESTFQAIRTIPDQQANIKTVKREEESLLNLNQISEDVNEPKLKETNNEIKKVSINRRPTVSEASKAKFGSYLDSVKNYKEKSHSLDHLFNYHNLVKENKHKKTFSNKKKLIKGLGKKQLYNEKRNKDYYYQEMPIQKNGYISRRLHVYESSDVDEQQENTFPYGEMDYENGQHNAFQKENKIRVKRILPDMFSSSDDVNYADDYDFPLVKQQRSEDEYEEEEDPVVMKNVTYNKKKLGKNKFNNMDIDCKSGDGQYPLDEASEDVAVEPPCLNKVSKYNKIKENRMGAKSSGKTFGGQQSSKTPKEQTIRAGRNPECNCLGKSVNECKACKDQKNKSHGSDKSKNVAENTSKGSNGELKLNISERTEKSDQENKLNSKELNNDIYDSNFKVSTIKHTDTSIHRKTGNEGEKLTPIEKAKTRFESTVTTIPTSVITQPKPKQEFDEDYKLLKSERACNGSKKFKKELKTADVLEPFTKQSEPVSLSTQDAHQKPEVEDYEEDFQRAPKKPFHEPHSSDNSNSEEDYENMKTSSTKWNHDNQETLTEGNKKHKSPTTKEMETKNNYVNKNFQDEGNRKIEVKTSKDEKEHVNPFHKEEPGYFHHPTKTKKPHNKHGEEIRYATISNPVKSQLKEVLTHYHTKHNENEFKQDNSKFAKKESPEIQIDEYVANIEHLREKSQDIDTKPTTDKKENKKRKLELGSIDDDYEFPSLDKMNVNYEPINDIEKEKSTAKTEDQDYLDDSYAEFSLHSDKIRNENAVANRGVTESGKFNKSNKLLQLLGNTPVFNYLITTDTALASNKSKLNLKRNSKYNPNRILNTVESFADVVENAPDKRKVYKRESIPPELNKKKRRRVFSKYRTIPKNKSQIIMAYEKNPKVNAKTFARAPIRFQNNRKRQIQIFKKSRLNPHVPFYPRINFGPKTHSNYDRQQNSFERPNNDVLRIARKGNTLKAMDPCGPSNVKEWLNAKKEGPGRSEEEQPKDMDVKDTGQMQNTLNGNMASQIVDHVFERVKGHPHLHSRLSSGLHKTHGSKTNIKDLNAFRNNETEADVKRTEEMLKTMMGVMNEIILDQVALRTCKQLSPELKNYLMLIIKGNTAEEDKNMEEECIPLPPVNSTKIQKSVNPKQGDFLFVTTNPQLDFERNAKEINKKITMIRELLAKYRVMDSQSRVKVREVEDYLKKHLSMLQLMLKNLEVGQQVEEEKPSHEPHISTKSTKIKKGYRNVPYSMAENKFRKSKRILNDKRLSKNAEKNYGVSQELIDEQLESVGLGPSASYRPPFNINKMIQENYIKLKQHNERPVSNPEKIKNAQGFFEYEDDDNFFDVLKEGEAEGEHEQKREVSGQYKKLVQTANHLRKKKEIEERLGKLFGQTKKKSGKVKKYHQIKSINKESQELSKIAFEKPVVLSLER